MSRRPLALLALGLAVGLLALASGGAATPALAAGGTLVPISGAGSTWSSNAVQAWTASVRKFGMQVNFQATGSSDGRRQFTNKTVDFAVSEIPYGLTDNGVFDTPPKRGYAYMPIVAGGTSFMYNLRIRGQRVTQLRLSGETITKIFTGVITKWNDPQIAKENPGLLLPARQVVPVFRSDGSGSTAQFTLWMSKKYPALWNAYCKRLGLNTPCGFTSQFTGLPGSSMVGQAQSVGVAGYVSQATSEGAITYVEYSYALNARFPVVKVLNKSGYYVEPTAENVAVGLLQAKINQTPGPAYLTQVLDGVYDNPDRRAYPLSSYSYMIIPTDLSEPMNKAKGYTLGAFADYFLCKGQAVAPDLGYSPLPKNLVEAGLEQVRKIPGADQAAADIRKCNNPTFSASGKNLLALNAPYPPACDKAGPTQCGTKASGGGGAGGGGGGGTNGGTNGGTAQATPGFTAGPGGGTAAGAGGLDPGTGAGGTGAGLDGTGGGGTDQAGQAAAVDSVPLELTADYVDGTTRSTLMALGVVVALGLVVLPPLVARHAATRAPTGPGGQR